MVNDYRLDKVLKHSYWKINDTKTLIETDDNLPDDITLKKYSDINDVCY